nr:MAG TPA: hypothetical protein [Caudoviricetes sp.]
MQGLLVCLGISFCVIPYFFCEYTKFSPIFFEKSPTICEKDRSFCSLALRKSHESPKNKKSLSFRAFFTPYILLSK